MKIDDIVLPDNYKDIFDIVYNSEIINNTKRVFVKELDILEDIQYELIVSLYYNKPLTSKDYYKFISFQGDNNRIEICAIDENGKEFTKTQLKEFFKICFLQYVEFENSFKFNMEE